MNGEEKDKIRSFTDLRAWREGHIRYAIYGFVLFFIFTAKPALGFVSGNYYLNTPVNFGCVNNNSSYYLIGFEPSGIMGNPGDECNAGGVQYQTWGELRSIYGLQFGTTYPALELLATDICLENPPDTTNYTNCLPTAISVGSFRILNENMPTSSGNPNHQPVVEIISPRQEGTIGEEVNIKYQAADYNSSLDLGLTANPVSIFYIHNYDLLNPIIIAEGLSAVASYTWDTSGLDEGIYRIIIKVEDAAGLTGEAMSQALYLDNSKPVFIVRTEPPFSRGEDVKMLVESSEDLAELPEVTVVQKNSNLGIKVIMAPIESLFGQKRKYQGIYKVIPGYDGPAKISVSGKDPAGNIGDLIVSGGVLNIGIDPPPKPVILSPFDQEVVASESISVTGTIRDDTEAVLLVNGADPYTAKPNASGAFLFENIKLDKIFNQGLNVLNIVSRDLIGNESEGAVISVKYNIKPEASFKAPLKGETVSGTYQISMNVLDQNKDRLRFSYEASQNNGETWKVIASDISLGNYSWNTHNFFDGPTVLKTTVNDGFGKTIVVSDVFLVQNFAPVISFTGEDREFINKNSITIQGVARGSEKDGQRFNLALLEYSTDRKSWVNIRPDDGSVDSFEEKFFLNLTGLKEGANAFFFRAKDIRDVASQARKILVVDFESPPEPEVISPKSGNIVSNKEDRKGKEAGVQFDIIGVSEPESTVEVLLDGEVFKAITDLKKMFKVPVTVMKHGVNKIKIKATDRAGNESGQIELGLIYNNLPEIIFLKPRDGRGLNHKAEIRWEAVDPDGDEVRDVKLSYQRTGDEIFKYLNIEKSASTFLWDVSGFAEGRYQLKLEATDGTNPGVKIIDFFVDNNAPKIELTSLTKNVFTKEFVLNMSGKAFDGLSGVEFVEFSVDPVRSLARARGTSPADLGEATSYGTSWFKTTITRGFLAREAAFRIRHKLKLDDGIYNVRFRAVDAAGNLSDEAVQKVVVDTKPPRVGSYTISDGAITLLPEGGRFLIPKGEAVDFKISLEADTKTATLSLGENVVSLVKNNATGLWETKISLNVEKFRSLIGLKMSAGDTNGNKTENKEIGELEIIKKGKVSSAGSPISEAKITAQIFDEDSQSFVNWQAEPYGRENPIYSDPTGEYNLLLPVGKYQLLIKKKGFQNLKVSEFNLEQPRFVNFELEPKPREGIRGYIEDIIETYGNQ